MKNLFDLDSAPSTPKIAEGGSAEVLLIPPECSLTEAFEGDDMLPTPNNMVVSTAIQALMAAGSQLRCGSAEGWIHNSYAWKFTKKMPKSVVSVYSSAPDFEQRFAESLRIADIAANCLIAAAYAQQRGKTPFISERGFFEVWNFRSEGRKRKAVHDQISTAVECLNSICLSYENLPTKSKHKPLTATGDFLVRLVPVRVSSGLAYNNFWKIELGAWAQTYLSKKCFFWTSRIPKKALALSVHIKAQRYAKYITYALLGFPGGTHHFRKGATSRKISNLLGMLSEYPKSTSTQDVRNWKAHIKDDMEKAFSILCSQGLMDNVEYALPLSLPYNWSTRWLRSVANFTFTSAYNVTGNPIENGTFDVALEEILHASGDYE